MMKVLHFIHSYSCHEGAQVVTKEHEMSLVNYAQLPTYCPPSWQCLRSNLLGSFRKPLRDFVEGEVLIGTEILWQSFC